MMCLALGILPPGGATPTNPGSLAEGMEEGETMLDGSIWRGEGRGERRRGGREERSKSKEDEGRIEREEGRR